MAPELVENVAVVFDLLVILGRPLVLPQLLADEIVLHFQQTDRFPSTQAQRLRSFGVVFGEVGNVAVMHKPVFFFLCLFAVYDLVQAFLHFLQAFIFLFEPALRLQVQKLISVADLTRTTEPTKSFQLLDEIDEAFIQDLLGSDFSQTDKMLLHRKGLALPFFQLTVASMDEIIRFCWTRGLGLEFIFSVSKSKGRIRS